MPDLERRLRLNATRARAVGALSDIKMWDWIEEHFRTTKLFHTSTHLTARPFAWLVPRPIALTDDLSPAPIGAAQREAGFLMSSNRGKDIQVVSVHPLVAERMGLTWFDPDARHRWQSHAWTYRE